MFQIIHPLVDIAVFAVILAVASTIIQFKFLKVGKMKEAQREMKEKQKLMRELMKKGDEASKKKAEQLSQEIMQDLAKSMQGMPKMMIVSMIIFLPPLYALRLVYFDSVAIMHPFGLDIPFFGSTAGWFEVYIVFSLISSSVLSVIAKKVWK